MDSILERQRQWVTLRLYDPDVPFISITECILSSQVCQASGPAHEVRLENIWVDGGSIIIVHIELVISSVSSNLRSWTLKAEG